MAHLYLLDKPFGENGLKLAIRDEAAAIVLIQDGVYMNAGSLHEAGLNVYAVKGDAEKRGLLNRLPEFVRLIDYGQLVDLIVENKVINFA
jgi:sulfur relay protein TusB/DsrH